MNKLSAIIVRRSGTRARYETFFVFFLSFRPNRLMKRLDLSIMVLFLLYSQLGFGMHFRTQTYAAVRQNIFLWGKSRTFINNVTSWQFLFFDIDRPCIDSRYPFLGYLWFIPDKTLHLSYLRRLFRLVMVNISNNNYVSFRSLYMTWLPTFYRFACGYYTAHTDCGSKDFLSLF